MYSLMIIALSSKNLKDEIDKLEQKTYTLDFTIERPSTILYEKKTYKMLPLLDFSINIASPGTPFHYFIDVYYKPTQSKFVMTYQEWGPETWKKGCLIFYVRRIISHTSSYELMTKQLDLLEKQFLLSGYPKYFISQTINTTVTKVLYPETIKSKEQEETKKWLPLFLPYSGKAADKFTHRLKQVLPSELGKITIAYKSQKFFHLLPKYTSSKNTEDRKYLNSDLVYKYKCSCGLLYLGETERRWDYRIEEHQSDKNNSAIYLHVQNCSQAQAVDRDKFSIVQKGLRHKEARKRFESLYILFHSKKAESSTMNENLQSRQLSIF